MGAAAGPAAAATSIASIGLQYYAGEQKAQADTFKAEGESQGDTYQAERLDVAAQYGDLKATQTSGQMTRNLNTTLGNIDAVRAAAGTDPTSPTGAAVRDNQEFIGNTNKEITVGNINAQTEQERSDAAYYRTASANALISGQLASSSDMASAEAGAAGSLVKGISGLSGVSMPNIPGFNPIAGISGS
jgi:hypothetical protein